MKDMKNINEIISFIERKRREKQNFKIDFEGNGGFFLYSELQYEIEDEITEPNLRLYTVDYGHRIDVMNIREDWFVYPEQKKFENLIEKRVNKHIVFCWGIMNDSNENLEVLVIRKLTVAEYIGVMEIARRYGKIE